VWRGEGVYAINLSLRVEKKGNLCYTRVGVCCEKLERGREVYGIYMWVRVGKQRWILRCTCGCVLGNKDGFYAVHVGVCWETKMDSALYMWVRIGKQRWILRCTCGCVLGNKDGFYAVHVGACWETKMDSTLYLWVRVGKKRWILRCTCGCVLGNKDGFYAVHVGAFWKKGGIYAMLYIPVSACWKKGYL
jgi:hypothetical protein